MERAEKKRARGEDDDADAGPAASRATPGEPRVDHAWRRREGHSVDTVLAQGGFVGHRDGFRSNEGGFLGDATGSIIPPIFPSTTYARVGSRMGYDLRHMSTPRHRDVISDLVPHDDDDIGDDLAGNQTRDQTEEKKHPLMYSRPDNPTYTQAESVLASLEGGADAALFASGMAAVSAVASAALRAGDRAAVPKNCYFAVRVFFQEWCERYGVDCVLYDCEIKGDLENAVRGVDRADDPAGDGKCKLLWIETPSNPTWRVTDIRAAAAFARACGAVTCCDATVLTPLVCRPLTLGADLVMHSATKYLNGHSDVVAGAVIGRKTRTDAGSDVFPKVWDRLLRARSFGGSVLGPFEAWLLLRGMRTLHVRVRAQCATAAALANKLRSHPCVAAVYYPGLETHPGHAVARAQQSSPFSFSANACATTGSNDQKDQKMFGGMLSVRCVGGGKAAVMTTSMTKVWFPATSLGGVESLVEHRKTVEGPSSETPDDLLRLSVGLEHADDLYRDLSEALWDAHGRIMSSAKWRKMQDARKALEENGR
jgi:cystathionine gamma-synthase